MQAITFSPKVFLPVTNLCRNVCDYCTFRRAPSDPGAWTMTRDEITHTLDQAAEAGCVEALFCLGDTPETRFPGYRRLLAGWGFSGTVDYLVWAAERALERGLLPHTNAGILSAPDMERLKRVNVSLGLMLESVADRLCDRGGPHSRAPDKRPAVRLKMLREAGELKIPFTTGLLIGIGETWQERLDTLDAICDLHAEFGHIQEVIVQNFRAKPVIPMANAPEPDEADVCRTVAEARKRLPAEIAVQAPPNLNPASIEALIEAGIDDLGGISPLTPDYINPAHAWPHLGSLRKRCQAAGRRLHPRLPIYDRFIDRPGFLHPELLPAVKAHVEKGLSSAA